MRQNLRPVTTDDSGQIITSRQALAAAGGQDLVQFEDSRNAPVKLTIGSVKRLFSPKATDEEAWTFIQVCRAQRLNPFLREAYLIKYDERAAASIVVGVDVFVRRAEEHPDFLGFQAGVIVQRGDQIVEEEGAFYLPGDTLIGGWFRGWRQGRDTPHYQRVLLSEYDKQQSLWKGSKATMIRKVAKAQGLREMYPKDFTGLYIEEERGVVIDHEALPPVDQATGEIMDGQAPDQADASGFAASNEVAKSAQDSPADGETPPPEGVGTPSQGDTPPRFESIPDFINKVMTRWPRLRTKAQVLSAASVRNEDDLGAKGLELAWVEIAELNGE